MSNEAPPAKLRSSREPPPYFAGRAKELAALNKRLDDLLETGDPTGGMALIVGVPGAGKTQLVGRKFAEDAAAREASNVRHLAVDTTMLENDVDLFMAIARTLGAEAEGRRRRISMPRAPGAPLASASSGAWRKNTCATLGVCPRC